MIAWKFWPEKSFSDVYENIYIRTFVEDWFKIAEGMAEELKSGGDLLDVGCGEGHTAKQILDRINGSYSCDLIEPDKQILSSAKAYLSFENNIREGYATTLRDFETNRRYDAIYTSHTNYYWADQEASYQEQLKKLIGLLKEKGKLLILTLPARSDHYQVMLRPIYPAFDYAEYIAAFYKQMGLHVTIREFRMRFYVGDFFTTWSLYDAKVFFRFIHAQDAQPSDEETQQFLGKIKDCQKDGYLDFRDNLLVIQK